MMGLRLCYTISMPNAPRTPARTVRITDEVWEAAQTIASAKGITVTSIIRAALDEFIRENLDILEG